MGWDDQADENEDFRNILKEELFGFGSLMDDNSPEEILYDTVEQLLNDFYHEKVVPLEKEVKKLGGVIPFSGNVDSKIYRYNPADPFKEVKKYSNYWEVNESDYYKFFVALYDKCIEKVYLVLKKDFNYDDAKKYWLWMFSCISDISFAYNEDGIIEIPFKWSAQKNLCVYFTQILINDKYITQRYSDKVIQQHFLPDSKTTSIANMRTPFTKKVDDIEPRKPRGHEGIDKMVSDILKSLD